MRRRDEIFNQQPNPLIVDRETILRQNVAHTNFIVNKLSAHLRFMVKPIPRNLKDKNVYASIQQYNMKKNTYTFFFKM